MEQAARHIERHESDAEFVARSLAGDRDAFALLIERHWRTGRRVARRLLMDSNDIEDVLQESALAVYLNLHALRSADRFVGWYCGIILNHCRMHLRRARRFATAPLEKEEMVAAATDRVNDELLFRDVLAAIGTLPPAQRDAALLVYLDGMTIAQAAETLGISPSALKVRLHRARAALREKFDVPIPQRRRPERRPSMAEVEIFDVALRARVSKDGGEIVNAVILLKEKGGSRVIPVWVGEPEATALAIGLQGVSLPRPITYSFAAALLGASGARVRSVTMSRLVKDTYYASVEIERGRTTTSVDARPSDAINLAVRTGAPIYADEAVLGKTGVQVRVMKADRAGSTALIERFEERMRLANEALAGQTAEPSSLWQDLGLELLAEPDDS